MGERADDRKAQTINDAERKSGGCVRKAVGLTSGGLRLVLEPGLGGSRGPLKPAQKSAEGKVGEATSRDEAERPQNPEGSRHRRPERSPQGVNWRGK